MSQEIQEALAGAGIDFALAEDCVKAMLLFASDKSINGTSPTNDALMIRYSSLPKRRPGSRRRISKTQRRRSHGLGARRLSPRKLVSRMAEDRDGDGGRVLEVSVDNTKHSGYTS